MRNALALRNRLGHSQYDVHRATGILPATLSRFERGDTMLRYPALKALAAYYGCEIDDLLATEEVPA